MTLQCATTNCADRFGVFRTAHRTTGGIYLTILNLNHRGRDQPRNHNLCGFVPNGAKFSDTCGSMMEELRDLAKGVHMTVNGKEVMVISWIISGQMLTEFMHRSM